MTKDEAIALGESEFWKEMTMRERAVFQLNEPLLCMPFDVFHEAIEKTLGRSVWTHELAYNWDGMKAEVNGDGPAPSFREIMELVPVEKRILVVIR